MNDEVEDAIEMIKHAFEYGFHCNDMTHGEVEEDISFAVNKILKHYGHAPVDWDAQEA
jgi:hypothetical protein